MSDSNRKRGLIFFVGLATLFLGLSLANDRVEPGRSITPRPVQLRVEEGPAIVGVRELSQAIIAISEVVTPAVVRIQAERPNQGRASSRVPPESREFSGPPRAERGPPQPAGGTGLILSPHGYLLTTTHGLRR